MICMFKGNNASLHTLRVTIRSKLFLSPALICLAARLCHLHCSRGERAGEEACQCQQSLNQHRRIPGWSLSVHTFWLGVETKIGRRGSYVDPCHSFPTTLVIPSHGLQSKLVVSLFCPKFPPHYLLDKASTPRHDLQGPP